MISVSVAATASRADANAADAGALAVDAAALSDAPSAFQALLSPDRATREDAAAATVSQAADAVPSGAALGSVAADGVVAGDADTREDAGPADADGNALPPGLSPALPPALPPGLPPGLSPLAWLVAAAPTVVRDGQTVLGDTSAAPRPGMRREPLTNVVVDQPVPVAVSTLPLNTDLERFNSGPHRVPGFDPQRALLAVPLPTATQSGNPAGVGDDSTSALPLALADADAATSAMLERFSSAPHRLPANAIAAFGAAQMLRLGDGAGRSEIASILDGTRQAVDIGLNPASASASASTGSPLAAPASGFAQTPGSAAWGQALDQQVLMMMQRGAQQARIRLHPQELGQLDIRLSMGGDRVDLNFTVQHAAVAGALQQHLPQLTQMLADQGLSLGHTSVSHEQAHSDGAAGGHSGSSHDGNGALAITADSVSESRQLRYRPAARGLLDIFA